MRQSLGDTPPARFACLEERRSSPLIKAFFDVVAAMHTAPDPAELHDTDRALMDPVVAALVIASAVLHPLREVYIKDNAFPKGSRSRS